MGHQDTIDHLRDLIKDSERENETLRDEAVVRTDLIRRAGDWVRDHARHAENCEEDQCVCGLEELKKDLY